MTTTKIAIVQMNSTVGDLAGNAAQILAYAAQAASQGANIMVTPELSLAGYPPEDLLLRPGFYQQTALVLEKLKQDLIAYPGLHVLVGHPHEEQGAYYNAVSVLADGQIKARYFKHNLPNNMVFDELRYFQAGQEACVFELNGTVFGINICEDTWFSAAPAKAKAAGAQVLLVPNGSPYHMGKQDLRLQVMREHVSSQGMALIYANLVGGQDELIFDGNSFALDAQGQQVLSMGHCKEELAVLTLEDGVLRANAIPAPISLEAQIYDALVLGVRDYVNKNGFPGVLLGLSGGVDSALTLAIACDALGADKVRAIMMPSPYTADISLTDSRDMVQRLGVRYDELSISPCFDAFRTTLQHEFQGLKEDTTEENIQARIRGTLLMAMSNKYGSIVLTTGNKSEMAVGYCTLYGDMAGGFAVIKDIAKTLVYRLCAYRNQISEVIPERIITRPPSAELRPDQKDQDSLPPYEILDGIMRMYMEENCSRAEIVAAGYAYDDVERITRLIKLNEYKRRQAPIGIRITHRAFGRDWRHPITSKFRD